ncbi:MAG: crotonase/enoyl-CoA hydratase family protein [Hyphomicrobiaceae bacterium]
MSDIDVKRVGHAQILRFNRPLKKNALTGAMYGALADALVEGDRDDRVAAHCFIGAGGEFTAGNDISEFVAAISDDGQTLLNVLRFVSLLPRVEKPMIAGVEGLAVGIGTTLLFHCDLVYATDDARFATPFVDLGLVPEAASSLLMPQRLGYARAFEMLVLGLPMTAERMREAGLVNAIVAPDDLEVVMLKAAAALAAKPPAALRAARSLMRGDVRRISERIEEEAAIFARALRSVEAREAFQAFIEKRAPDFKKA